VKRTLPLITRRHSAPVPPTHSLPRQAVIWLEDYLQKWKSTLLIVSHDQDFLSAVVTDIVHLEDRKLWYYKGNYDDFKEAHRQKVAKQLKDFEKQQKAMKAAKDKGATSKEARDKEIAKMKRIGGGGGGGGAGGGGGGGGKGARGGAGGGRGGDDSDDDRAKSDLIAKPKEYTVNFSFNDPPDLAPPILSVVDASFRYGEKYPWLFKKVNCGIDQSSRIAIVGPNGVGKSTFLSLLIGDLEPTSGTVVRNRFLRIGKYSQHFVDVLPMDKSPVEFLQSAFGDLPYQHARAVLGRFGLESHAHTIPSRDLSGGQKARVVFANLSLQAPHILVLDEPSNNLDAESIDALGTGISAFKGGVVLVSHDARLIRNAGCQLWVCDAQDVAPFDGELDDYKASLLKSIHEEEESQETLWEAKAREAEEARLAAVKERARRLREMRAAAAAAAGGGAPGGAADGGGGVAAPAAGAGSAAAAGSS